MKSRHPAYRRYTRRMAIAAAAYIAAIFVAVRVLPKNAPPGIESVAIALVPGLAVLGMIWGFARLLVELDDEYLRLLEVRKALISLGLTLAVTSMWGLLETFTTVPRLPIFWIFPIWALGLFVGMVWNKFTLGDGGCA